MKLTIVREDGAVYKDGYSFSALDLSAIPDNVHALQFNDSVNKGWIEFVDAFENKPANEVIVELPTWAITALVKWDEAKLAEQAAIEAARIKQEEAAKALETVVTPTEGTV